MTRALAVLCLVSCSAPTAKEARDARDEVTNAALETARAGCIAALADPKTEWENPDAMGLCVALSMGGCPK